MADVDINPFGEHELRTESRTDKTTNETFPLTPRGGSFVTRAQVHVASGKQPASYPLLLPLSLL